MITVMDETTNDSAKRDAPVSGQPSSEPTNGVTRTLAKDSGADPQVVGMPMPPAGLPQPPFSRNATTPPDNSDLMSRLKNFLPQMQSANQQLLSKSSLGTDLVQLDTNLQAEENSDSDTDDDEKASKTNPLIQEVGSNDENPTPESLKDAPKEADDAPTIQLEFTLGNMTGNPMMKFLSNDGDDDEEDDESTSSTGDYNDENPSLSARNNAVAKLLTESKPSTATNKKKNIVVLDSIIGKSAGNGSNKSKEKKSLITELS